MTLYHWDLPQALEERGGWRSRETVERFAEYAAMLAASATAWTVADGKRAVVIGLLGYLLGLHAPGEENLAAAARVFHHLLLAHGRAVQELRSAVPGKAGVAFALAPRLPGHGQRGRPRGGAALGRLRQPLVPRPRADGLYPEDIRALYEERIGPLGFVRVGDLEPINTPSDFIGVNYYTRRIVRAAPGGSPVLGGRAAAAGCR